MDIVHTGNTTRSISDFITKVGDLRQPLRFEIRPRTEQVVRDHPSLIFNRTPGCGPASQRIQLPLGLRENPLVRKYGDKAPATGALYRRHLTQAAQLAQPRKLSLRPTRAELQGLSDHIGQLLTPMVEAVKQFDVGATQEVLTVAKNEAGNLKKIAERLTKLGTTLDSLSQDTRDVHSAEVAECTDKLDRAYASLYMLVKEVDCTYFNDFKALLKKVFPESLPRYFATRAIMRRTDQRLMWQSSGSMQRWVEQRRPGLLLKPGELIPSVGISLGHVGKVPVEMKADALVHYAINIRVEADRVKALDIVFAELQNRDDPARRDKIFNVLNTLVEDRILKAEYYKTQCSMLDRYAVDPRVTTEDYVTRFFSPDFFKALTQEQKDSIFARLQGEYAPLSGSALRAAVGELGWQPDSNR